LAVILAVTISYLFYSLTFNPKIAEIRGGSTIQATLGFGMFVVTLASAIIVLYAHSFVMKNRSKELGIYGMLGLEKRHLISMTFKELVLFGILTVGAGIGIGALFDKLILSAGKKIGTLAPSEFTNVILVADAVPLASYSRVFEPYSNFMLSPLYSE